MRDERGPVIAMKPDFLILGAKRAGTTSLFDYLMQHPKTVSPAKKELDYLYAKDFKSSVYLNFFPTEGFTGEATPNYLIAETCARRIRELNPHIKLIALLREPVSRMLSEYPKQFARGLVTESLSQLVHAEIERLHDISIEGALSDLDYFHRYRRTSYLLRGLYLPSLKAWHKVFPRESLLVLNADQLFNDAQSTLDLVLEFLELEPWSGGKLQRLNSTKGWMSKSDSPAKIQSCLLAELAQYFAPHNERLYEYLGQDFEWTAPAQYHGY